MKSVLDVESAYFVIKRAIDTVLLYMSCVSKHPEASAQVRTCSKDLSYTIQASLIKLQSHQKDSLDVPKCEAMVVQATSAENNGEWVGLG